MYVPRIFINVTKVIYFNVTVHANHMIVGRIQSSLDDDERIMCVIVISWWLARIMVLKAIFFKKGKNAYETFFNT